MIRPISVFRIFFRFEICISDVSISSVETKRQRKKINNATEMMDALIEDNFRICLVCSPMIAVLSWDEKDLNAKG